MASNSTNDSPRLIRHAEKSGPSNPAVQRCAFNIISAICKAFSPQTIVREFTMKVGCGYLVSGVCHERGRSRIRVIDPKGEAIYLITKGKAFPEDGMLPLDTARIVINDITGEWLPRMLAILEHEGGNNASLALSAKVGDILSNINANLPKGA